MTTIEVVTRGSLIGDVVRLRSFVTKSTQQTRISAALAEKLGLTELRDVYVRSESDRNNTKWKVSIFPIKIWCHGMVESRSLSIYPLVNTNVQGAYYEMILGRDSFQQLKGIAYHNHRTDDVNHPLHGSGYRPGKTCDIAVEFTPLARLPRVNAFLEYNCTDSKSVFRLAINKVTRQMAVIYRSSGTVYCYAGVSKRFEIDIERGESKGRTMTEVKQDCHCKEIDSFPVTTLVEPQFGVRL